MKSKDLKNRIALILAFTSIIGIGSNVDIVSARSTDVIATQEGDVSNTEIIVEKPRDFKAEVTGLEVTLSWTAPESKEGLTGYTLYKDGKAIVTLSAGETSYKLAELRENTLYGFKIVSNYSNGESSKPVSINVRTEIIKAKARDFRAENVTSESVMLRWSKPEYPGGLTGYSIYKDGKLLVELDATQNKYEVKELKANRIYSFKIVSNYTNGESKPVSLNIRTTK